MSTIAQKVATEHTLEEPWRCGCGQPWPEGEVWEDAYPRHIATVTDAELRAHLAAQFTAKAAHARNTSVAFTWQQAARTAGGEG